MSDALQSIGCAITPDFISADEESALIAQIESVIETGESDARGRSKFIRYGWDYAGQHRTDPIPKWIDLLRDRLPADSFDAVTINQYQPGCSIRPHIDSRAFGEPILILGLGAACIFALTHEGVKTAFNFYPRSLVALRGPSRFPWQHAVEPVKELRYSIVFRTKK